jgi:hypothetical protein
MKRLYCVGDSPFVKSSETEMPIYPFEDINLKGEIGWATYFLNVLGESPGENLIKNYFNRHPGVSQ